MRLLVRHLTRYAYAEPVALGPHVVRLRPCPHARARIESYRLGVQPEADVRWSGSFGSAYLYFVVPRVILFRWEHSRRTLVDTLKAPVFDEHGSVIGLFGSCRDITAAAD